MTEVGMSDYWHTYFTSIEINECCFKSTVIDI